MQRPFCRLHPARACCFGQAEACVYSPSQAAAAQWCKVQHHYVSAAARGILLNEDAGLALGITPLQASSKSCHTKLALGEMRGELLLVLVINQSNAVMPQLDLMGCSAELGRMVPVTGMITPV